MLATFAGGCFWCNQHDFDELEGVISTTVGYTGGNIPNPSYEQICSGKTGHVEAIQVEFDPKKITYEEILNAYWHQIDPHNAQGQFCDIGSQYKPIIFYHSEEQRQIAEESKKELSKKMGKIVVDIRPAEAFYPAEDYHQKYYRKKSTHYEFYHAGSGREKKLKQIWGG